MRKYVNDNPGFGLSFLYKTAAGRLILKLLVNNKYISVIVGWFMNQKISCLFIKRFIKNNNIDMTEYVSKKYTSFNDFFTRKILPDKRPIIKDENIFTSCADSYLTCYRINDDLLINIKNSNYSIKELLKDEKLSRKYKNGFALVFRLTPSNYHRYHFIDNGKIIKHYRINGKFHTVNPICYDKYKVFHENTRECTLIKTENFDEIIYVEVGALLVGRIVNNNDIKSFKKGDCKGYFEFGGSTVILLIKKDIIKLDNDIIRNSLNGFETSVKCNEKIGESVLKK